MVVGDVRPPVAVPYSYHHLDRVGRELIIRVGSEHPTQVLTMTSRNADSGRQVLGGLRHKLRPGNWLLASDRSLLRAEARAIVGGSWERHEKQLN